ncbi:hypothetical protein C4K88_03310 [Arthrobacter pityocampae]|uniref:Uncharacterized protein n=1 Tax=Arthrobacter pityocampae TaxID=547334 RepID=A0A2S5J2B9_9MICC|nr:hypothetical protein [Arthrobacter pityocampae]PPB50900.1 hypothetical protein C4K88_03310 [Arthrobacter pityocampae]
MAGVLISAGLLVTGVGCAPSGTTDADRADFAGAQERMEHILPLLQAEAATAGLDLPLEKLAERSCLRSEIEAQQEQTRWEGQLASVSADPVQADAVVDAVSAVLASEGWELTRDDDPGNDPSTPRYVDYTKDGIDVSVMYRVGITDSVEVLASTDCTDHASDHQMLRSALDPGYSKSSSYYPDGE